MKYIILVLIILLIGGCTTVVEEISKPPQKQPLQQPTGEIIQKDTGPTEQALKKSADIPKDNIITIKSDRFDPDYIFLNETKTVIWKNLDDREHLISCYSDGGSRVFIGDKINKNQETKHTFKEYGTYLCIDAIYGLRGTVVIYTKPIIYLSSITGRAIAPPTTKINVPIAWPALLLITLSILFVYFVIIKKG